MSNIKKPHECHFGLTDILDKRVRRVKTSLQEIKSLNFEKKKLNAIHMSIVIFVLRIQLQ